MIEYDNEQAVHHLDGEPRWCYPTDESAVEYDGDHDADATTDTALEAIKAEIEVTTDEAAVNDEVVAALAKHPSLYQKGGVLVRVIDGDDGRPRISDAPRSVVRHLIAQTAAFIQEVKVKDSVVRKEARPPNHAVDYAYDVGHWQGIRRLESVVYHPVILPAGEIVTADGYEPETRNYIHLPAGLQVSVPHRPTQDEVRTAAAKLVDLLCDFPFAGEAHKSSWLAALLTPLATTLYDGPAPMFVFDANSPGVGKGKLADMIGQILTGEEMMKTPHPTSDEEMAKQITTVAIFGRKTVLLDNVAGSLGSPSLEAVLTGTRWNKRLLGMNKDYDGPIRAVWYATSNNAAITGDTFRRIQLARLVTEMEKPHERSGFRHADIVRHVHDRRGEYLSAALTILKGWIVAGRPQRPLPSFGSYEAWSGVVRQAIVFAGLPDPRGSQEEVVTARDEQLSHLSAVMDAIERMDADGKGVTAAAIAKRCREDRSGGEWVGCLTEVLTEWCRKADWSDLGYKLKGCKDHVVNGRQLRPAKSKKHGAVAYQVVKIGEASASEPTDAPPPPVGLFGSALTGADGVPDYF